MNTSNIKQNNNPYFSLKNLKYCSFFFIFINCYLFSQSNKCNASLIVEHERNVRSTTSNGTYYAMMLTNHSTITTNYTLKAQNNISNCHNPDDSKSINNVELNITFLDKNQKTIKEISVQAGQKIHFYVHVTVPSNTKVNNWSCTEIIANSEECLDYKLKTVLKTLVISSSEE